MAVKLKRKPKVRVNALQWMLVVITSMSVALFFFGIHVINSTKGAREPISAHPLITAQATSEGEEETIVEIGGENVKGGLTTGDPQPYIAYDEQGKPGYIHDPYYLRDHPLPFTFQADGHKICDEPVGFGQEGPKGRNALRKISVMNETTSNAKVLCMVYSYSKRHDVVRAVAETYGQRCDGFMVASNLTDVSIGAVNLEHPGPETYGNMWQKVRSMWQYVHDHYLQDFDFYHIGGDDMFVVADNLKHTLSEFNPNQPYYFGAAMVDRKMPRRRYCGGGAGYTLSRETVRQMITHDFNKTRCNPGKMRSDEDRLMGTCLRLKVAKCTHRLDDKNETLYHHYDAQFHARWDRRMGANWDWRHLLKWHNIIAYQQGLEGVAETTTTFHLISDSVYRDRGLRRYHALLYGLCGEERKLLPLNVTNLTRT